MEDKLKIKRMRYIFNKSLSKEKQKSIEKNLQDLYTKENKIFEIKKKSSAPLINIPVYNLKPIRSNSATHIKEKPKPLIQSIIIFKKDNDKYALNSFMLTELPKEDNLLPVLVKRLTTLENKVWSIEDLFNRSYNNNLEEHKIKLKSSEKTKEGNNDINNEDKMPFIPKKTVQSNKVMIRLIKPSLLPRQRSKINIVNSTCNTDKVENSNNSSFCTTKERTAEIVYEKISFKDKLNSIKDRTKKLLSLYQKNTDKNINELKHTKSIHES